MNMAPLPATGQHDVTGGPAMDWVTPQQIRHKATNTVAHTDHPPALAVSGGNTLYAAWTGIEGDPQLYWAAYDPVADDWTERQPVPGARGGGPGLADYNNQLYLVYEGASESVMMWTRSGDDGKSWTEPTRIYEPDGKHASPSCSSNPSLVQIPPGLLAVFASPGMGMGQQYYSAYSGDHWGPGNLLSGHTDAQTVFDPGATNFRGELYLAWRGYHSDNEALFWATAGSEVYDIRSPKPVGYRSHTAPKLAAFGDLLYMAYRGEDGDEHLYWITFDGTNWDKHWMDYRSEVGPALGVAGDRLYMAYKGETGDSAVYYTYMQ